MLGEEAESGRITAGGEERELGIHPVRFNLGPLIRMFAFLRVGGFWREER